MHRANREDCPPIGEAARQAYQCAVDRILRALTASEPSVVLPHNTQQRPRPPWAQTPGPAAAAPAQAQVYAQTPAPQPPMQAAAAPPVQATAAAPAPAAAAPQVAPQAAQSGLTWDDPTDAALDTLSDTPRVGVVDQRPQTVPAWYPEARVDERGIARRRESWISRSKFAIACTVACLALIAAVVLGTLRRAPAPAANGNMPAALASVRPRQDLPPEDEQSSAEKPKPRKPTGQKAAGSSSETAKNGKSRGK
jgi:hypothetical protein